jgi:AraC-like DNA-binding protein
VDLSAPYDFSWSGDGAAGCVQIPIDELGLPVDVIRRAVGNVRVSPLYRLVRHHVAQLAADADRICADPGAPALGAASIELARALLVSAAQVDAREVLADTLLTRVRAYVRQHLTDPDLGPAPIAAAHNVSLRHLYKVCARAGLSLEQWIIAERLRGARDELVARESTQRPIGMIARRWGFRDPTHFARRFRAEYGMTPSEWRRGQCSGYPDARYQK